MGLFTHSSMRPWRNLASLDMAGLNSFITGKIVELRDMTKLNHQPVATT
jgi:hypothetical protein